MPPLLRHVLRTFDGTILLLVAVTSFGLALAKAAGFIGIPLALMLFSWFFKYAYALLEEVAHGIDRPPVMSVEMVNPVSQRPLAQLAICGVSCAAVIWADGGLRWALIVFFVASLPASVAILGATGNVLQALNPLALVTVIKKLGRYYLGILLAVSLAVVLVIWTMSGPLWMIAQLAIAQLAILAVFNVIGGALYERRDELDLDVMHSPEQSLQREEEQRLRERGRVIDAIYTQARVRKYAAIDSIVKQWLDAAGTAELDTDVPFMVASAVSWNDRQALARVAPPGILRLHGSRLTITALDALDAALNFDPAFQLGSLQACVELAELARAAGRRALARKIVAACANPEGSSLDIVNRLGRLRGELER